jgi:hypothetical protein
VFFLPPTFKWNNFHSKKSNIYIKNYEKGKLWTPHVPLLVHLKVHSPKYTLNPNYATLSKHDIDKILVVGFIRPMEEVTWLSSIVIVPKKNGKLKIYVDFKNLNATMKKDFFPLPFIDEVLNIMARCEDYSFLDGYSRYHQMYNISLNLEKCDFTIFLE